MDKSTYKYLQKNHFCRYFTCSFACFFIYVIWKKKQRRSPTSFKRRFKKRVHNAGKILKLKSLSRLWMRWSLLSCPDLFRFCSQSAWFLLLFRHFEEKAEVLEEVKRDLQGKVEDLQEENDHLKRQCMMESEAKSRLRQEASQLTAENMVCVDIETRRVTEPVCKYVSCLQ